MPDLPSLAGLTSSQLIELSEHLLQVAYQSTVRQAAQSAQERLLGLVQQLGERQEALRSIVAITDEQLIAHARQSAPSRRCSTRGLSWDAVRAD